MCFYRTSEGICKKFSVDGATSYCLDGPCPDEVPTNADRIRSMSDEEQKKFFAKVVDCLGCPPTNPEECIDDCEKCWGIYLRQPAEEDET